MKVPVKTAAAEIGCSPELLKARMRTRQWDLGMVDSNQKRRTYYIFRHKLDRFLGKEGDE